MGMQDETEQPRRAPAQNLAPELDDAELADGACGRCGTHDCEPCRVCEGAGVADDESDDECAACGGAGCVVLDPGACDACQGSGDGPHCGELECSACKGGGRAVWDAWRLACPAWAPIAAVLPAGLRRLAELARDHGGAVRCEWRAPTRAQQKRGRAPRVVDFGVWFPDCTVPDEAAFLAALEGARRDSYCGQRYPAPGTCVRPGCAHEERGWGLVRDVGVPDPNPARRERQGRGGVRGAAGGCQR